MSESAWLIGDLEERVSPKLRSCLTWTQHSGASQAWWIVSDPVGNRHFRCEEFEAFFLRLLDGRRRLPNIIQILAKEFSAGAVRPRKLQAILKFAETNQLLVPRKQTGSPVRKLKTGQRQSQRQLSTLIHGLRQTIMSLAYQRVIIGNPHPLARYWASKSDWLFSTGAVSIWTGFILTSFAALLLAIFRVDHSAWNSALSLATVADWRLWLGGMLIFMLTRVFHEAAHAIACVRQGARCHQAGLMRILCIAFPYVDVTDAWRIADRNARIAVFAAGIYVDLIAASIAVWIWQLSSPGLIHDLSLMTVAMGITGSVLFNANPLMKYDGYYVLSDYLEVADLQRSSRDLYRGWLFRCLHGNQSERLSIDNRAVWVKALLAIYAPISKVYRWVLALGILVALLLTFHAWHMTEIGWSMTGLSVVLAGATCVDRSLWKTRASGVTQANTDLPSTHTYLRSALFNLARGGIWLLAAICLVCLALLPLPERIHATGITASRGRQPVYVTAPTTTLQSVQDNLNLSFQFSRDAADAELMRIRQSIEQIDSKLASIQKEAYHDSELLTQLPQLKTVRDLRLRRYDFLQSQSSSFNITIGENRRFLPVPLVTRTLQPPSLAQGVTANERLASYDTLLQPSMLGARLERGTLVGYICDPELVMMAEVRLKQTDRPALHMGQNAKVRLEQFPHQVFNASIVGISQLIQNEHESPSTHEIKEASSHYIIELALESQRSISFVENGRAEVVFATQGKSLASRFIDYANQLTR